MSRKLAASSSSIVNDAARYLVVQGGIVKPIVRALVVDKGIARQYWPPSGDGTDPRIRFIIDAITIRESTVDPTSAVATITFTRATGQFTFDNFPGLDITDTYLDPPLDGTAGDDGKYLIRVDQISGVALGGAALGTFIDLNSAATFVWTLTKATPIGIANAVANIRIAGDNGAGAPIPGTEVVKVASFIAEVLPANDINWSTLQRDLVEIKEGIDATCDLKINKDGTAVGEADTSGSFSEDWHRLAPTPGDLTGWTVRVNLISGTAPTGDVLGSAINFSADRRWTLTATGGQNLSNELDVIISDGTDSVTKRVTMNSQRTDAANKVVWTTVPKSITDIGLGAAGTINIFKTGVGQGVGQVSGINFTENWHSEAPAATDPNLYEVQLDVLAGPLPDSGSAVGVLLNLANDATWTWTTFTRTVFEVSVNVTIQPVGRPSLGVTKLITLQISTGVPFP